MFLPAPLRDRAHTVDALPYQRIYYINLNGYLVDLISDSAAPLSGTQSTHTEHLSLSSELVSLVAAAATVVSRWPGITASTVVASFSCWSSAEQPAGGREG